MVARPVHKRFSYGLAAFGLTLAACGGGAEAVSPGTENADQPPEVVADAALATAADLSQNVALSEDDELVETDPGPFTGDPDSAWCNAMGELDSNPLSMDIFGLTPEEMESQFTETREIFTRMETIAPDEIRQDVNGAAEVFRTFVVLGAEAGWDFDMMLADPDFVASFDLIGLESAVSQIERYTLDVCGIELAS